MASEFIARSRAVHAIEFKGSRGEDTDLFRTSQESRKGGSTASGEKIKCG